MPTFEEFSRSQRPFENIITLGCCCLPKSHVNRFFSTYYPDTHAQTTRGNYLFDWMVPNNYSLFANAVDEDLRDVFGNIMRVAPATWARHVPALHNRYEMVFNHAFDGHPYVSHEKQTPLLLAEGNFQQYYPDIHDKFLYLTQKSLSAFKASDRTLYIAISGPVAYPHGQKQEDFLNLLRAIKRKRDSNFLFIVLITESMLHFNSYILDTLIDENLYFHKVGNHAVTTSLEGTQQWDGILSSFSFTTPKQKSETA